MSRQTKVRIYSNEEKMDLQTMSYHAFLWGLWVRTAVLFLNLLKSAQTPYIRLHFKISDFKMEKQSI